MKNKIYRKDGYYYAEFIDATVAHGQSINKAFRESFSYEQPLFNRDRGCDYFIYLLDITPEITDKLKNFAKEFNIEIDIDPKNIIKSTENRK